MAEIVTLRDEGLGNASYLVDLGDGRGLVVDPSRDPGPYLAAAERRGLRLGWTVETHLHADFVSGQPRAGRDGCHGGRTGGEAPARALARALWRPLHERILTLPDDLAVYPTHGAGSFCSAPTGVEPIITIGREKQANPLLAAPDEDAFVQLLFGGLGSYPRYFLRLRQTNRHGPRVYGATPPPLALLSPDQVRRLVAEGAELIDARPISRFAAGHVPGALSVPLRSAFATWLGWLVGDDRPLVVVLDHDQDRDELVRKALKVGYERLAGELAGGMAAWAAAGLPQARIPIVEVADQYSGTVLDVRQDAEFAAGHLPGAAHVELGALTERAGLPAGPLAVMCAHGQWAMTGASLLQRAGHGDLTVLVGGPGDWSRATGRRLEPS